MNTLTDRAFYRREAVRLAVVSVCYTARFRSAHTLPLLSTRPHHAPPHTPVERTTSFFESYKTTCSAVSIIFLSPIFFCFSYLVFYFVKFVYCSLFTVARSTLYFLAVLLEFLYHISSMCKCLCPPSICHSFTEPPHLHLALVNRLTIQIC